MEVGGAARGMGRENSGKDDEDAMLVKTSSGERDWVLDTWPDFRAWMVEDEGFVLTLGHDGDIVEV